MEQEVPVLVYTQQMVQAVQGKTCTQIYELLGFHPTMGYALCVTKEYYNNTRFNFDLNATLASRSLMNIWVNNDTYGDDYYWFLNRTGLTYKDINATFADSTSTFSKFVDANVALPVFNIYNTTVCKYQPFVGRCSNRILAYNQWANGNVISGQISLFKDFIQPDETVSYTKVFAHLTKFAYTPELSYYLYRAELPTFKFDQSDLYNFMNPNRAFNMKIIQDIMINATSTYKNPFNVTQMRRYFRFISHEGYLGGLFVKRTPKEFLDGYTDPIVDRISKTPIWKGGDGSADPFMAITKSKLTPSGVQVSLFAGTDNYLMTRKWAIFNGVNRAAVTRYEYVTLKDYIPVFVNPWNSTLYLAGTDGGQFHPVIEPTETLEVFVSDLMRVGTFEYKSSDTDTYSGGLEMMKWTIKKEVMDNSQFNLEMYSTKIFGSSNLSSCLSAPLLATKGHFFQFQQELVTANSTALIIDEKKNPIVPTELDDETYLGVEKMSGVNLEARQRLQMTFYLDKQDPMWEHIQNPHGFFIPLTNLKRENTMTQQQVDTILKDLITANTARTVSLVVLLVLGVIIGGIGVFLIIKFKKITAAENLNRINNSDQYSSLKNDQKDSEVEPTTRN